MVQEGRAQNFPIRASVTVVTPSPYLEDYGRDGNVIIVLTLVDNRPSYEVFLRLTIEGNGFQAVTNEATFMGRSRILTRGTPLLLRGPELAPYFNLNNLDISGFGIDNTLENGGRLPDGPITICAEFFDINRFNDPPVSNPACATRFVQQNYPPELVAPLGEITNLPTSLVNFSWNPRHIPQPANDEYILEIWEKIPGLTYDQIVNSTPTVRDPVSTFVPRYTFNNYDARLSVDKAYIWRVQIRDRRNVRFFVNNGYSAFGEFNFGEDGNNNDDCTKPTALFALNTSMNAATLGWSVPESASASGLQIRYRGPGIEGWSAAQTLPLSQDSLTLTNLQQASAYEAELCVICSDGTLACTQTSFTTTLEDTDCGPMPTPVAIPITEEAISLSWALNELAAGYRITWAPIIALPTTVPATQRQQRRQERSPRGRLGQPRRLPTAPASAPSSSPTSDSLLLGSGAISAEIGGLTPGTDYNFNFCQICPDGTTACFNWTLDFNGINDDCLTSLNFTRPDSTETTLDLAWTYNPSTVAASDSFQLIWQVSDRSYPETMATVAYADGAYTITDRIPGQTYTLRVCAECTLGQPVCTDLPPFGGCPAEYSPELADLDFQRALLGWDVAETPVENTEMRYAMRSFGNWSPVVIGQFEDFDPTGFPFPTSQLAETPKLQTQIVYLAQLRNQCYDTLWSAWSEPVAFSLGCAVVDTLTAQEITDVSAEILSPPRPNADYYQFYYRLADTTATEWTVLDNVPTNLVELNSLFPDTTYEVKMRFWCSLGVWSDFTDILTFNTLPPCGTPENTLVDPILATAAGIEWLMGENALETTLQYRLMNESVQVSTIPLEESPGGRVPGGRSPRNGQRVGGGAQQNDEWLVVENLQDSVFLSDLNGGSRYQFRLQSDCGVNLSEWSAIDEFTLLCAPPDQLSVDEITHESAQVTIAGLSPTAGTHEYSYRRLGDSVWQSITRGTAIATLLNLDDLATYDLRVRTKCDAGQFSIWSDTLQFSTLVDCRVPTNLGVAALSPTSADLRWDVTGTVTRWEVRVWGTANAQTPATQQQQFEPGGGGRVTPGGTTPGTGGAVPGRGGGVPSGTGRIPSGGGRVPVGGGTVPNGGVGSGVSGQVPGPVTQNPFIPPTPPDPYANWEVFSVTDPSKVLQDLSSDRKYKVVVRAECPTFGWTEYTDVLEFRTLCHIKSPDTAYVDNLLETTAELYWSGVSPCLEDYQVVVESLTPVSLAGSAGTNTSSGAGQTESSPAGTRGGRTSPGPGSTVAPGAGITQGIYRDSILTTDQTTLWSDLVANTEYRFRVRARINKSEFTPESIGYTTMEAWAASGGANAGAEIVGEASWGPYTSWVTFRTDHCAQPYDLVETTLDRSTMEISWTPSNGVNDYEVKYKLADDPGSVWAYVNVTEPVVVLENLLSNAIYDYQVTELCQSGTSFMPAPQDTFIMKKPSLNNGYYVCGLLVGVDLSNEVPLPALFPDDTIRAFDFPVVITAASGGGGIFSGEGEIRIPYFNKAKMKFVFNGIFVNDDYQMVGGFMEATGFGIEVLPPWADTLLAGIITGLEMLDDVLQDQQVDQLDSLLMCCSEVIPGGLQNQMEAIVNCFDQVDEANTAAFDSCEAMMDSLLLTIQDDLQDIIDSLEIAIIDSKTIDLIRLALDSLKLIHEPSIQAQIDNYNLLRINLNSTVGAAIPLNLTLPSGISPIDRGPPCPPETVTQSGIVNTALSDYFTTANSIRSTALVLTENHNYATLTDKIPATPRNDIKVFAEKNRTVTPLDTLDVFALVRDMVVNLGENEDPDTLRYPVRMLLQDKIHWLVRN